MGNMFDRTNFQMPQFGSLSSWGNQYGSANPMSDFSLPTEGSGYGSGFLEGGMGNNFSAAIPTLPGAAPESNWLSGMVGTPGAPGWGGMAMGAASGLANTFLGMKQYGLAKKSLAQNKEQFQMNYDAQKKTTNSRLEDRQKARVASNSGAYESVGDYMKKYAV